MPQKKMTTSPLLLLATLPSCVYTQLLYVNGEIQIDSGSETLVSSEGSCYVGMPTTKEPSYSTTQRDCNSLESDEDTGIGYNGKPMAFADYPEYSFYFNLQENTGYNFDDSSLDIAALTIQDGEGNTIAKYEGESHIAPTGEIFDGFSSTWQVAALTFVATESYGPISEGQAFTLNLYWTN